MKFPSIALASSLALSTFALPSMAAPQTTAAPSEAAREEGRVRFRRGVDLYKEGNFHAALAEFRAAFETAPSSRIQYNLGQTLFQLQDYAGALAAFEAYVADGHDSAGEDRAHEVEADIAKLRPRVATLKIATNLEIATQATLSVAIDDEVRALSKGTLRVSAGRRKIHVTAPGYQTETRVLDVAGSAEVEVRFELKPLAKTNGSGAIAVAAVAPRGDTGPRQAGPADIAAPNRTPVYVALGATAALGIGAITFGVLANSKYRAWERATSVPDPNRVEVESLSDGTKVFAITTDVLTGLTVASGLTSVVLYFLTDSADPAEEAKKTATSRTPWLRPLVAPGAFGLTGAF
jgi:hypothetical protein